MNITKQTHVFVLSSLATLITLTISGTVHLAHARDYFNPALLELDNPATHEIDLSFFEKGSQAPGKYRVDIIINNQMVDTREIEFFAAGNDQALIKPCLSTELLQSYGIKTALFPALNKGGDCANITAIPQATADFLFSAQKLILSIPQAALSSQPRGYVAPEMWSEGVNAVLLNYSVSANNSWDRSGNSADSNSQYANLRPGINLGAWRIRNYSTWNRDIYGESRWDSIYTYAQRNIIALKSQLTLGDSSSPSEVFDSIPFRGGQLASDDEMMPDSLKGYAPVVRGIARTNAQVIIRQNGYTIYQSYVAAGAFEITDMYPTGGSGDLNVTIKEADGSEQNFLVPFASIPVLQREGRLKYSITGGQYRAYNSRIDKTPIGQGTAIYGLPNGFTIYGGLQSSSKYQSLALGVGKNMGGIGALSTDVTQAWSRPHYLDKTRGESWRIRYSKNFTASGTNFAIAGYRYSTAGYYGMQEVLNSYGDINALQERRRNRTELTVSQTLGSAYGAVTGSAVREDYWQTNKRMESYGLSYNNSWQGISFGVNYTYSKNSYGTGRSSKRYDKDQIFALNVSVPLARFLANSWANYNLSTSKQGNTTHTVGVSGLALAGNALSWNAQQGYGTRQSGHSGNLNATYRGTYAEVTAGYSYDKNSQRINYGLNGGIIAHADGVTFAQPFGETIALVKAPGAKAVSVTNQTGARTDFRGYTVVSNVSPYRKNDISLDTETLADDVELQLTTKSVIPTRGAIALAEYRANVGHRIIMTLTRLNGQPVPFGAMATVNGVTQQMSVVGDNGQIYLSGLKPEGEITLRWGKDNSGVCQAKYVLDRTKSGVQLLSGKCL